MEYTPLVFFLENYKILIAEMNQLKSYYSRRKTKKYSYQIRDRTEESNICAESSRVLCSQILLFLPVSNTQLFYDLRVFGFAVFTKTALNSRWICDTMIYGVLYL